MIKKIKISFMTEVKYLRMNKNSTRNWEPPSNIPKRKVSPPSIHTFTKPSQRPLLIVEFLKTTLHPYTISRSFFEESPSRGGHHRGIFPCTEEERKKGLFIRWAALIAAIVRRTLDQAGEPFEQHEKTCLDHRSGASMQTRRGLWTGGEWFGNGKLDLFRGNKIRNFEFLVSRIFLVCSLCGKSQPVASFIYIYIFIYFCIGYYDFLVIIILELLKLIETYLKKDLETRHEILLYSLFVSFHRWNYNVLPIQDFTDCTKVAR